jgi:hypothetical protein
MRGDFKKIKTKRSCDEYTAFFCVKNGTKSNKKHDKIKIV